MANFTLVTMTNPDPNDVASPARLLADVQRMLGSIVAEALSPVYQNQNPLPPTPGQLNGAMQPLTPNNIVVTKAGQSATAVVNVNTYWTAAPGQAESPPYGPGRFALSVVQTTGVAASDTLTVGGTYQSGAALSTTITPVSGSPVTVPYTSTASDTNLNGIAASLATAINKSTAVAGPNAFLQPATVNGAVITLAAMFNGTSQNAIGLTATGGGTVTLTAGAATFAGGS
jgi:hypothetical protein